MALPGLPNNQGGQIQPNDNHQHLHQPSYQHPHNPDPCLQQSPEEAAKNAKNKSGSPERQQIILDGEFLPAIFRTQSYEIAKDICRYVSRGEDYCIPPTRCCSIMRNLVDDAIKDRPDLMKNLVQTLAVRKRDQLELVRNVANQLFDDEQVNWGRIVTLHAFCGSLARHCEAGPIPDCADDVGNILAQFVVNRLGLWIVTHGGWKAFEAQFPSVFMWGGGGLWKGLIIIALLIGALLAFYSSVRFISGS